MLNKKITVLVADDHPLVRKGLIMVLKTLGIKNILEAEDGNQAVEICEKHSYTAKRTEATHHRCTSSFYFVCG
jgi:CheY-like chemotaxis protein